MFIIADRVQETSASTGTGSFALVGTVLGFRPFSSVLAHQDFTYYCIANRSVSEWEVGIGRYLLDTQTLERVAVLSSSNNNALVNFGSGTKDVFINIPSGAACNNEDEIFGDGSDGDANVTVGVLDLTRDTHYNSLTISGTGSVHTNGFELKVATILDLSNAPANAICASGGETTTGSLASGYSSGTNVNATIRGLRLPYGSNGSYGASAGSSSLTSPGTDIQIDDLQRIGSCGGPGGQGGAGAFSAGSTLSSQWMRPGVKAYGQLPTRMLCGIGGSGGGGGTASTGGAGGGGGAGGNWLRLCARLLKTGPSTAAGAICAAGGNGANGTNAATGIGGGGGGGGGGGVVDLHHVARLGDIVTGLVDIRGGHGGNGGNGSTGQAGGNGGTGGNGGVFVAHRYDTRVVTEQDMTGFTGTAGGSPSGSTGGAGGAGYSFLLDY